MRMVELTKLGSPAYKGTSVVIPYNGDIFEFLDPDWRAIARWAAASEEGIYRDGDHVAKVYTTDE